MQKNDGYIYAAPGVQDGKNSRVVQLIEQFIQKKNCRNILDVACGHGYLLRKYPRRVIGIDIDRKKIAAMKKEGVHNIKFGDATKMPFRDASFDCVIANAIIEHLYVEGAFRLMAESARVLKKGGYFIVFTTKNSDAFWDTPDHIRPYSNNWIRRVCIREMGVFESVDRFDFVPFPCAGLLRIEGLFEAVGKIIPSLSRFGMFILRKK